ncbi:hypothetical protein QYE76_005189 [Lolium multiflorum]|uniref:Transposase (putative) gypsy type domain-containing protein n=1 Tax=Lolium multiflorum TaxID=4521 RepID=A0AAD8W222_LOLMU|nr:hypothetical protein QYE76_005189 [Lolium multiflorum]
MATPDLGNTEWERSKISAQDVNLLKKLGLSKKKDALRFPSEESYPTPPIEYRVSFVDHLIRGLSAPIHDFLRGLLFVYGLQLHHLTPNSILHISIFITLCESFLGVQPNWALWKCIFLLRRNGFPNIAYNIGGVVICVRPDVEFFDVKFPDSVQGWRKKWLYVREECADSLEHNIPPFNGNEKILRRRSWDAEATDEEKSATKALMTRIHELQNTLGQELSGISKHQFLSSLPPLPEGREVEERTVVTDDNQGTSRPKSEVAGSHKSAASSEKEVESEAYESSRSLPSAASPKNKRKRDELEDSGTSKAGESPVQETSPEKEKKSFNPYEDALVSSGDEEEEPIINVTAHTSTSHTLVLSDSRRATEETSPSQRDIGDLTPPGSPRASSPKRARTDPVEGSNLVPGSSSTSALDDPLMQQFIRLGTQFVGYRDHANSLKEALAKANKRADDLALELAKSEKAREKAELESASVESLRKRLHDAENALSERTAQQLARDCHRRSLGVAKRRFVRKTSQEYGLEKPEDDRLLDALSLLEIYGDEVRQSISDAKAAFSRLFPYFFPKTDEPNTFAALAKRFIPKEDLGLALLQENLKIGVEGTIALVAESQQHVDWAKVCDVKSMETKK